MYWEIVPLPRPMEPTEDCPVPLSRWSAEDDTTYEPNPDAMPTEPSLGDSVISREEIPSDVELRTRWYLRRGLRIMIPAPVATSHARQGTLS